MTSTNRKPQPKEKMKLKTLLKNIRFPIYPERDPETDRPHLGSTGYPKAHAVDAIVFRFSST